VSVSAAGRAHERAAAAIAPVHVSGATEPRRTLRPQDRLKLRRDFVRAQQGGRKVHTAHFVVCVWARSDAEPPRLGVTVTRKIGGAVQRNRVKRVIREVFRCYRELFPVGCDVVLIAKDGAPSLGMADALLELRSVAPALSRAARPAKGPPR
jgi:ribonuclease P protein component